MFVYHDFIDCKIQVHTCIVKFYLKKKTTVKHLFLSTSIYNSYISSLLVMSCDKHQYTTGKFDKVYRDLENS